MKLNEQVIIFPCFKIKYLLSAVHRSNIFLMTSHSLLVLSSK